MALSDVHSALVSDSGMDTDALVLELEESRQNDSELASLLEATEYANKGAEDAAKHIMALGQQLRAKEATVARLQEQNATLIQSVKYWNRMANKIKKDA